MATNKFKKLFEGVDITPLLQKLNSLPELWGVDTIRQTYPGSMHQDTECIFIRGPESFSFEKYMFDTGAYDFPAYRLLEEELNPILNRLLEATECTQLGRVLIVKLLPQGVVDEHIDEGLYAEHYSRFHIGLVCPEGSTLTVEGEPEHIGAGEGWWFNHRKSHTAENNSVEDRIHIIVDLVSPHFKVDK